MTEQHDTPPEMLLVSEVQKRLRLSRNGIYDAIARNDIPSVRIGRRILIPRAAFEEMLHPKSSIIGL